MGNTIRDFTSPARALCSALPLLLPLLTLLLSLPAQALDRVRLQLKWQHQFQFAGYYAAQAQGFYRDAGLEVEILPATPGQDATQAVLRGDAEFGVGTSDLLLLRARGEPVVVMACIFQHSPLALMMHRTGPLQSVHDLADKKLMIEPGSAELLAALRREGLKPDRYTLVPHNHQVADFVAGRVDAMSVYVTDETFELVQAGQPFELYSPRTSGIDFYGDNLFATRPYLERNPDLARRFLAASLKGWQYALDHPQDIAQLIYQHYSPRHSLAHLRYEAEQMVPLLRPDLLEVGHMYRGRWQHIAGVYTELGMLPRDFSLDGFMFDQHPPPTDLTWWYVGFGLLALLGIGASALATFVLRQNKRLSSSERRFEVVFQTMPVAFLITDRDGRIVQWNRAAEQLFGWPQDQAVGRHVCDLVVPESDQPQVRQVLQAVWQSQAVTHSINRNLCRNGDERLCEWFNAAYTGDDGQISGVISLGMDVGERELAREHLQQAKDLADQLLTDQKQFIAMVSHELRSPLAVMDLASQVLEIQCETVCGSSEVISRVRRGVKRLSTFIDNCLAEDRLARLEKDGLKPASQMIELSRFLESILEQARINAPDHRFHFDDAEAQPSPQLRIQGDPSLLRILLHNLLSNACKYSRAGSTVRIGMAWEGNDGVRITVSDQGAGIPAADLPNLGVRHFRGSNSELASGSGVGLHLCRRIIQLHGGSLLIESEVGVGSRFHVHLPLCVEIKENA